MATRNEPNIKIITTDFTNSTILTNTINTALVIKSSIGITEPQFIRSRAELLNNYSSKGFISNEDDITFKSAYYLLGFTPLYICRASSDIITIGLTNNGNLLYKDINSEDINSINTKLNIIDSSNGKYDLYYKTALNNVYYCGNTPTITGNKISLSNSKLSSEDFINLFISNSSETIIYNKTELEYQFISDTLEKITDVSNNYLKKSDKLSNYATIEVLPIKSVDNISYIILNNVLYYFDDGQSLPPFSDSQNVINKFSLRFPTNSLQTEIYITYLEQELLTKQQNYNSLIKFNLEFPTDIDVIISDDLLSYISIDANNIINSKNKIVDSGYIIISRDSINNLFYIGQDIPDYSSTGLIIDGFFQFNSQITLNRFLMGIYENKVFNNPVNDSFDYTGINLTTTSLKIIIASNLVVYESNLAPDVGSIINKQYSVIGLSLDSYNDENKIINNYYISLDNNVYYIGNKPNVTTIVNPVYINISNSPVLFSNLVNTFIKYIAIDYQSYLDQSKNINLLTNDPVLVDYMQTSEIVTSLEQLLLNLNDKFAIFLKFTSDTDVIKYSVKTTLDSEIFDLKVFLKGNEFDYKISFNPDKLDGFGSSLYFERINDINPYIKIVELNSNSNIIDFDSELYGSEISSLDLSVDDYINCLAKFEDLEGINFDLISSGGYLNIQYVKSLSQFGNKNYTKIVTTTPEEKTIDKIIAYKTDLSIDDWSTELFCQWFKTTLGDFTLSLPVDLLYIERVIANFNAGNQYLAVFGKNTGLITSNPNVTFNTKQREELLGNRIIPIKYDRQNNISYFVDNLNLTNQETYLGNNENFVRVINTMAHTADFVMEQFIARANNNKTQRSVVEKLTSAFTELGLFSNEFINDILIVCDDSNNTQDIKDQNKLVVTISIAFNNSIKYITVYQKVVTTIG